MKNNNKILIALGLLGAYYLYSRNQNQPSLSKRQSLVLFVQNGSDSVDTKTRVSDLFSRVLTDSEINAVYEFIFNYVKKGRSVPSGSILQSQIAAISAKYNIFT